MAIAIRRFVFNILLKKLNAVPIKKPNLHIGGDWDDGLIYHIPTFPRRFYKEHRSQPVS